MQKDIPKVQTVKVGFGRGVPGQLPAKLQLFMWNRDCSCRVSFLIFGQEIPWTDSLVLLLVLKFSVKKHFCGTEGILPSHGLIWNKHWLILG